jgi:hypothetical protein
MSVFKSLLDKAQAKKAELEKKAARKAAEKTAELAIERGKQAALAAVEQAGKSLKSAGATLEEALFGPDSEAARGDAEHTEEPVRRATEPAESAPPARDVNRARPAPPREDDERFQREVDEELAALKRKIARK